MAVFEPEQTLKQHSILFSSSASSTSSVYNKAVKHFTGENPDKIDLREFESWYDFKTISYLCHLPREEEQALKCIFHDGNFQSFRSQLEQSKILAVHFNVNLFFISKEPGLGENHYIFGMIFRTSLLIINPVGETMHMDFYKSIETLQQRSLGIDKVYLSKTQIQKDPEGLVSCGPICVELMNSIARMSISKIEQDMLSRGVQVNKHELTYLEVEISPLLPTSLTNLLSTGEGYKSSMEGIRANHLAQLALGEGLSLEAQNSRLDQAENSDEQVLLTSLFTNPDINFLNIDEREETKEAYQRLQQRFGIIVAYCRDIEYDNPLLAYNEKLGGILFQQAKEIGGGQLVSLLMEVEQNKPLAEKIISIIQAGGAEMFLKALWEGVEQHIAKKHSILEDGQTLDVASNVQTETESAVGFYKIMQQFIEDIHSAWSMSSWAPALLKAIENWLSWDRDETDENIARTFQFLEIANSISGGEMLLPFGGGHGPNDPDGDNGGGGDGEDKDAGNKDSSGGGFIELAGNTTKVDGEYV